MALQGVLCRRSGAWLSSRAFHSKHHHCTPAPAFCIEPRRQVITPASYTYKISQGVGHIKSSHAYSTSALYIPHEDNTNVAVVEVDLDLEVMLKDVDKVKENLVARGRNDIDVSWLVNQYQKLKELNIQRELLEQERERISTEMKEIVKQKKSADHKRKQSLIQQGKQVKQNLKKVQECLWPQEELVMTSALRLPNMRSDTLLKEDEVEAILSSFSEEALKEERLIIEQSEEFSYSIVSPGAYYLHGSLAQLELRLLQAFMHALHTRGLQQYSCPDFVKTLVMEGCGEDFNDSKQVYTLQAKDTGDNTDVSGKMDTTLHLVGGASYPSWIAFLTKMSIHRGDLPLRTFSVGRHYSPAESRDFIDSPQSNQVCIFGAADSYAGSMAAFEEYKSILEQLYTSLGLPLRRVRVCARRLRACESCRVEWHAQIQRARYVKVAELGLSSDFISKRLTIKCSDNLDDVHNRNYLHLVHGTVLNSVKLLTVLAQHHNRDGRINYSAIEDKLHTLLQSQQDS